MLGGTGEEGIGSGTYAACPFGARRFLNSHIQTACFSCIIPLEAFLIAGRVIQEMFMTALGGFFMALADSVPGVSGGTVAFIMGFYDDFIGSIERLFYGKAPEKKKAVIFLLKLGLGWVIGMGLAVVALNAMFESHIYVISSVFIGFIAGAIPLIIIEEKESYKHWAKGLAFFVIGVAIVVAVTLANSAGGASSMDLSALTPGLVIKLILVGMVAISAMFLPGISGSTMLLIFGAYMPVMSSLRKIMGGEAKYIPGILIFICGIILGAVLVVKLIRTALENFRPQTVYLILGMMIGSFYSIVMGPTTLENPQPAMTIGTFNWLGAILGVALVLLLQFIRNRQEKKAEG